MRGHHWLWGTVDSEALRMERLRIFVPNLPEDAKSFVGKVQWIFNVTPLHPLFPIFLSIQFGTGPSSLIIVHPS